MGVLRECEGRERNDSVGVSRRRKPVECWDEGSGSAKSRAAIVHEEQREEEQFTAEEEYLSFVC